MTATVPSWIAEVTIEELENDPYPFYARLREEAPLAYVPALGCWVASTKEMCRRIAEHGLTLVGEGDGILTHCNAGQLATVRYGTATAPMYLGHARGYGFHVYCDETRPLLQGARLTSFELSSDRKSVV